MQVLIPTYERHGELAVTLAGLAGQEWDFDIIIADQSRHPVQSHPLVMAMIRVLEYRGHRIEILQNPARQGIAQQRDLLFSSSSAEQVLMLDDDVWLAPGALAVLTDALERLGCGLVGMPLIGLSHLDDERPQDLELVEWWEGPPEPEQITPRGPQWERYRLHNAANPAHLLHRAGLGDTDASWRAYRIAWVGGCALYRRDAVDEVRGWSFWDQLPPDHAGEDVLVQLRVIARRAGAGILPSYAFHHEVATTLPDRRVQAYDVLPLP